jgi:hypothetical protein
MAKELRWHHLSGSISAAADADTEFKNQTGQRISIKLILPRFFLSSATADENASIELSKQGTFHSATNGASQFAIGWHLGMPATGATPADGEIAAPVVPIRFDEGEVVLDEGESVFVNIGQFSGSPAGGYTISLGYVVL